MDKFFCEIHGNYPAPIHYNSEYECQGIRKDEIEMQNEEIERYEYTTRVERNRNNQIVVTRTIEGISAPYTKWDFLSDSERRSYESMAFADGKGECSKCGMKLPTEADFAKHFTIPDVRYPNLGRCPNK